MKTSKAFFWWLISFFLLAGYILPQLYRIRFMLVVMATMFVVLLSELNQRTRIILLTALATISLFFFKIIPVPYDYLIGRDFTMGVAIFFTSLAIFGLVGAFSLVAFLLTKKMRFK